MHFHSRCNVNFICCSIMSLHNKFRRGPGSPNRQQMESASHLYSFGTIDALFEE